MIEKKFVEDKIKEYLLKEFIKKKLGKGKISDIKIERMPLREKIVIFTAKPGLVIGRGGEIIQELQTTLKEKFKLENPQIEIAEIQEPFFDAQTVADQIALSLEKSGSAAFKLIAYQVLEKIIERGALGAEIILSGKLPSQRAKSWRFAFGYLKNTGGEKSIVNYAKSTAFTRQGAIGVKVSIVPKDVKISDQININKEKISKEIKEETINLNNTINETKDKEHKVKRNKKK